MQRYLPCLGLLFLMGCTGNTGTEIGTMPTIAIDRDELERQAREEKEKAEQKLVEARTRFEQAALVARAKEAKVEIDKVVKSEQEIDVVFDKPVAGDEQVKAHQEKMKKLDRVQIDKVEVAYEQEDKLSVNAKTYKRHFRATYINEGKLYGFSYYTMEEIDGAAFAALLRKMFPIVNEQMTQYNIEVKRGE